MLAHLAQTFHAIALSLWVEPLFHLAVNICHFYEQQKVNASHFPLCASFSLMNAESKWIYNSHQGQGQDINSTGSQWHSTCLCYCTNLSLFTDCKVPVFSLHAKTSPWFPPPSRWVMSMHEILVSIAITIYILACMSDTQLIWWFHASL